MNKSIYFIILIFVLLNRFCSSYSIRDLKSSNLTNPISNDKLITINKSSSFKKFIKIKQKDFSKIFSKEPDFNFNAKQMIEYRGFKFEAHHVVTEDCYVLEMHRIVHPFELSPYKVPVLLQHGIIDASTTWISNSIGGSINDTDDRNLAFALARRGYDVWLGNFRGNTYSKNHISLTTKDAKFWRFTFDNHALQDLPAMIGYVQKATNYDQIGYVGFSEGTLAMFELLAMKPKVAAAIKPYIALAPVAYTGQLTSPIRYFVPNNLIMKLLLNKGLEVLSSSRFNKFALNTICRTFPSVCRNLLSLFTGPSDHQMNITRLPVYINNIPAGTSILNYVHFSQNIKTNKFQMLDFLSDKQNLICYNSVSPPQIPIENIRIKDLFLFHSLSDRLADPKDVEHLKQDLKVPYYYRTIDLEKFSHPDFLISKNNDQYVNNYVINILNNIRPAVFANWERLRLKTFNETTCYVPSKKDRCHLDLKKVLNNIY